MSENGISGQSKHRGCLACIAFQFFHYGIIYILQGRAANKHGGRGIELNQDTPQKKCLV